MGKRKSTSAAEENSDSDSSDSPKIVNFDFDFYDLNPTIDYLGIKTLLRQLFDVDATLFDLSELTELVLQHSLPGGSTVKTDGEENDPFAVLGVVDVHVHKDKPCIAALREYILRKTAQPALQAFHTALQEIFSQDVHHLGLIICERFRNMPVEVIPHLYRILLEESKETQQQPFSHVLIFSRTFHLTPSERAFYIEPSSSSSTQPPSSKRQRGPQKNPPAPPPAPEDGLYPFHQEDDVIKEFSLFVADYTFDGTKDAGERNDESFGLDTRGRVMLVEASRFEALVRKMGEVYAPPATMAQS